MTVINAIKKLIGRNPQAVAEKYAGEAYDLWAGNYDNQPGNLMLDLDEVVFTELLSAISLKNKTVADIGCGTGRHWPKMLQLAPARLSGFDVSAGMLGRLKQKYPAADVWQITDDRLPDVDHHTFDIVVSTLTVAHIEHIENAFAAWCRILNRRGHIVITDFHPAALAYGGRRTFAYQNRHIAIRNFVHTVEQIKLFFSRQGFSVEHETEKVVDETMRHYYEEKNAGHVYEKFKGMPMIYGLHLKR